jgi:hypothetical protein
MPYTAAQNRLFYAAANNEAIAKEHGLTMIKAKELAEEGVKKSSKSDKRKMLANALMGDK